MPKPKQVGIVIADLIRECLNLNPATSREVWKYVRKRGAKFENSDPREQRKSISGQLSKMYARARGGVKHHGKIGNAWIYAIK